MRVTYCFNGGPGRTRTYDQGMFSPRPHTTTACGSASGHSSENTSPSWRQASTRNAPEPIAESQILGSRISPGLGARPPLPHESAVPDSQRSRRLHGVPARVFAPQVRLLAPPGRQGTPVVDTHTPSWPISGKRAYPLQSSATRVCEVRRCPYQTSARHRAAPRPVHRAAGPWASAVRSASWAGPPTPRD